MRPAAWTLADLIDFETLVSQTPDETRDRRIAEKLAPLTDRRAVFHAWLTARRAEDHAELPGEHFLTGWHTLLTLAVITGLVLGGAIATPALLYHGDEPLNVVDFLACALGLQWALLLGAALVWLLRRASILPARWRPLHAVTSALLVLFAAALRRLPGEQRLQLGALLGRLDRRREIYGSLAVWPLLLATQLFAVCFNVGVMLTLLWRVAGHDQRFGWQTTLDIRSEQAGALVQTVAAPWSWAPNAHPSTAQVIATRYAPHQSHATLPPDAMRAWWPFLFYAVACYGLAVRTALLTFAALKLRAALRSLAFDHAEANALWRRLAGPLISSPAGHEPAQLPHASTSPHSHPGPGIVLASHELTTAPANALIVKIDQRHACAEQLAAVRAAALSNVAVIIPAERDPIVAIMLFLADVVAAAGEKGSVLVQLAGATTERVQLWRDFAARERLRIDIDAA